MSDQFDLPPEVADALETDKPVEKSALEQLAIHLVGKRDEAIAGRRASGIEEVWRNAEEAYLRIDDSNRGSFTRGRWQKPTTMQGPVDTNSAAVRGNGETRSTAYVGLTSRYVDAGTAKLSEILLPASEKSFSFSATPVQDVADGLKNDTQAVHNGVPLERDAQPGEIASATPGPAGLPGTPPAAEPGVAPGVPIKVSDLAKEALDAANEKAKKAEKRIWDWMVESRYRFEMRKVIFDAARIGVGILKGPFPRVKTYRRFENGQLKIQRKTSAVWEHKDPWNIFPDPACGEDIRDGDYLFEYETYTARKLRDLKGQVGYISDTIDKILDAGPQGTNPQTAKPNDLPNKHQYEVWHFYGTIPKAALEEAGTEIPTGDKNLHYAIVTMVNDRVIRAVLNPMDSGCLPYHAMSWQRRSGYWAGVGVGEQLEMPQRAINAAIRAMFNNAGKSAGSIGVINDAVLQPVDGRWEMTPDKLFKLKQDIASGTVDDVRKAINFFEVPNVTDKLMRIVEMCLKLAEESTNIPLVTQGQSGSTTPETYGAAQLQNNNANQLLRSIGYTYDDQITEPTVLQAYEYLLLDPNVPDDEKGDWTIDAHGSVTMVERAIQENTVRQMGEYALNPVFGVNPKKWFAQFSIVNRLNPKEFQYTEEEQRQIDSKGTPPPPAVQVAQIKVADAKEQRALQKVLADIASQTNIAIEKLDNQSKEQIAQLRAQVEQLRIQKDTDRDTVYAQAEAHRVEVDGGLRAQEMQLRRDLEMLKYATQQNISLEQVKKELAISAAELNTQKQIAGMSTAADLHKHATDVAQPGTEVPGRAPKGEAFAK